MCGMWSEFRSGDIPNGPAYVEKRKEKTRGSGPF